MKKFNIDKINESIIAIRDSISLNFIRLALTLLFREYLYIHVLTTLISYINMKVSTKSSMNFIELKKIG